MARKQKDIEYITSKETHVFCGWIVRGCDQEYNRALILVDHRPKIDKWGSHLPVTFRPLADEVYHTARQGMDSVSVAYHITDEPHTEEELTAMVIAKMCGINISGDFEINYSHRYSEMTGYLWTDEKFQVGGHDIIAELSSSWGKWCHLILTVHRTRVKR